MNTWIHTPKLGVKYPAVYNYILAGDFDKTPDFPTFADGHYEMLLCEAIERSAHEKAGVKVK